MRLSIPERRSFLVLGEVRGDRLLDPLLAPLAAKITLAVAPRAGRIARAVFREKTLQARPRLQQRAVDRNKLARKQAPRFALRQRRGAKLLRHLATGISSSSASQSVSTAKHPKVSGWPGRHARFHSPTCASWLNARRLKHGVFNGVADLHAAINRFRTADPDAIIEKVHSGKQALASMMN